MSDQNYRPLYSWSLLAIGVIGLVAALDLVSVAAGIGQIVSPDSRVRGESVWLLIQGLIAILNLFGFVLAGIFFFIWLNRAHKNLSALRAEHLEFSSGWAVGWWFVPFANLVKPFQVVREIWCESDPDTEGGPSFLSSSSHAGPTYIGLWGGLWIAANFFPNTPGRIAAPATLPNI